MNTDPKEKTQSGPHKILIEIDSAMPQAEAISFARRMGAPIGAQLVGCFVENQALMDLAELPFASEVSFSGIVRPLESERLVREWGAQAAQAKAAFAAAAVEMGLEWSFDVKRGQPLFAIIESAVPEDVLVMNTGNHLTSLSDIGRALRAATSDVHADVLLTSARRGIGAGDAPLVVLDDMTSQGEFCAHVAEALASRAGMTCMPVRGADTQLTDLAEIVRQMGASLVVASAQSKFFEKDDDAMAFSMAVGCPVLLLGSERDITSQK
jgi:hypothetical protein